MQVEPPQVGDSGLSLGTNLVREILCKSIGEYRIHAGARNFDRSESMKKQGVEKKKVGRCISFANTQTFTTVYRNKGSRRAKKLGNSAAGNLYPGSVIEKLEQQISRQRDSGDLGS